MTKHLPNNKKRQVLEKVLKEKKSVSLVCREAGISRTIFYRWQKQLKAGKLNSRSRESLPNRKRYFRQTPPDKERLVLETVLKHPEYSSKKISQILGINCKGKPILGNHGVQNVLRRFNLSKRQERLAFRKEKLETPKKPLWLEKKTLSPQQRMELIRRVMEKKETVVSSCCQFGISRTIFYRWAERFKKSPKGLELQALNNKERRIERYWRQVSPAIEKLILDLVLAHPEYSVTKIAASLPLQEGKAPVGYYGVQRVLERNNLNTYQRRLIYQQSRKVAEAPTISPAEIPVLPLPAKILRFLIAPFATVPKLLSSWKVGAFSLSAALISFSLFFFWLKMLYRAPQGTQVGLIFATISLLIGTFFFIYSLKYYFVLTLVLGFSRQIPQKSAKNNGSAVVLGGNGYQTNNINGNGNGNNKPWWKKIFSGNGNGYINGNENGNGNGKISYAGGLQSSLDHITLQRKPLVSIHLALYNEKRVVERLLTAATSMEYENYEVIVVDDSTDETTGIALQFLKGLGGELGEMRNNEGNEIYKFTPLNPHQPSLTLIHRVSREGYKGGALQEALKVTNPQAEFVLVFDADFIPYPDTITQFLKYFQSVAGTLDFQNTQKTQKVGMSENQIVRNSGFSGSPSFPSVQNRIAAVQGYQWHVLNKSENWITRGVRSEYAGSYVVERSGAEILGALKQIAGSVYMIRRDILSKYGWGVSITEDFELTLRLYKDGYKVIYTPYVQAPSECVSTIKRLIRQRMRWAEGHSHNVRKMFWQLMWGRWEEGTTVEDRRWNVGLEDRGLKLDQSRRFIPSRLTFAEKLEFLYLSPYYLQAAFFILGTFSWFLAEAVFKVRLPFWTSLWGWSLVLTNLFSLPLLNTVGLFLEEAEERDYLGILSFVVLTYLLAPFQAYAAVKGFLEKEEGPWFRTPKTGRITDAFTPGRFYRFIWKIFGRPTFAPAVNAQMATRSIRINWQPVKGPRLGLISPYLSLATANNSFSSFRVRPRRLRWVGKTFLTVLLLISTLLTSLAPYAPAVVKPALGKEGVQSGVLAGPGLETDKANSLLADNTLTVQAPGETPTPTPTPAEGPEPVIPTPTPIVDPELLKEVLGVDSDSTDSADLLTPTPTPLPTETPTPTPPPSSRKRKIVKHDLRAGEALEINIGGDQITNLVIQVLDSRGRLASTILSTEQINGENFLELTQTGNFRPGEYTVKITNKLTGEETINDFTWGVLAVNASKSVYKLREQAFLQMAALDKEGHTLCEADLTLEITAPTGLAAYPTVQKSGKCGPNNVTDEPDYYAFYEPGDNGLYQIRLTNNDNGYQINDSFEAWGYVPFSIERTGPTRIYPPSTYEMKLEIIANQDFSGIVEERVPSNFELSEVTPSLTQETKLNWDGSKSLFWEVDWGMGETREISYRFKAPNVSPYFYLLGPLTLREKGSTSEGTTTLTSASINSVLDTNPSSLLDSISSILGNITPTIAPSAALISSPSSTPSPGQVYGLKINPTPTTIPTPTATPSITQRVNSFLIDIVRNPLKMVISIPRAVVNLYVSLTVVLYTPTAVYIINFFSSHPVVRQVSAESGGVVFQEARQWQIAADAISGSNIWTAGSTSALTYYGTTGNQTPGNNNLVLAWIVSTETTGTAPIPMLKGNGLNWVNITTRTFSVRNRITLFRAMAASGITSGTVGISYSSSGGALGGTAWSIVQFSDVDTSGTDGSGAVIQSATAGVGTGQSIRVTLSSFSGASNATAMGVGLSGLLRVSPESGHTLLGSASYATPNTAIGSQWLGSNDTTPTMTFSASSQGSAAIAVEIAKLSVSIGGSIYQTDESTLDTTTYSVAIAVNNGSTQTMSTGSSGTYSFSGVAAVAGDDIMVYIKGAATDDNTVTVFGGANITNLHLYSGRMTITNHNSSSTTNADVCGFTSYPPAGDNLFTCSASVPTYTGFELHLLGSYAPGGDVNTTKLHIPSGGNYSGGSETLTISGTGAGSARPFINAGTFTASTNTTKFTGTSASDIETGATYNSLSFLPASGAPTYTINSGLLDVNGTFTIGNNSNVAADASSNNPNIELASNLSIGSTSVFVKGTGTLTFNGNGTSTWTDNNTTKSDMGAVAINGSSKIVNLGSSVKAASINIASGQTLSANGSNTLTLTGNGTPFTVSGTFTSSSGTVEYANTTSANVTVTTYNNLQFAPASGTPTYTLQVGTTGGGSSINWGVGVTFQSGWTSGPQVCALSSTQFVNVYIDETTSNGTSRVGTVSGTDISYGSEIEYFTGWPSEHECAGLDSSTVVVIWSGAGTIGWARAGTVSGSTISYGTGTSFNPSSLDWLTVAPLSSTKFVVVYRDIGGSGYGSAMVGTLSGTNISFGLEYVFPGNANAVDNSVAKLDTDKFVASYYDSGDSGHGKSVIGTVVGTVITFGSVYEFNANPSDYPDVSVLATDKFVNSFRDTNDSGKGKAIIGTVAGTGITYGSAAQFESEQVGETSNDSLSSTQFVITYDASLPAQGATGRSVVGIVSGTGITFGSPSDFDKDPGTPAHPDTMAKLDSTKFVIAWDNNLASGDNIIGTVSSGGDGSITINSDMVWTGAGAAVVNASTNNPPLNIGGNLTIDSDGVFIKGTATLTFNGSGTSTWTDNNTTRSDMGAVAIGGTAKTINIGSSVAATQVNVGSGQTFGLGSSGYNLKLTGSGTVASRPFIVDGLLNEGTNSQVELTGTSTTDVQAESYFNLKLAPSAAGSPSYAMGTTTGQTFTIAGTLTIGDGTNAVTATAEVYDPTLNITGSFVNSASGTFLASSTQTMTISNDFTNNGTFTANTGTVNFNDNSQISTLAYGAAISFYNLTINTASKEVDFDNVDQTNVTETLTVTGGACGTKVKLYSDSAGNQFDLDASSTVSVLYADIKDSNAVTRLGGINSADSGNNSNWIITADACGGAADGGITAYSHQRKTFYDATLDVFWRFSYDSVGSSINIEYAADPIGGSWTSITDLSENTADFSVWDDNTYVYIAFFETTTNTYDIRVRRGTLQTGPPNISWDASDYAALNGSSTSDLFHFAYITQDSDNYLWVLAQYYNGTNYYIQAVKSNAVDPTDPSSWGSADSLSTTSSTDPNCYGSLSSLGLTNMYAAWIKGTAIEGSKYTGTWAASSSIATGDAGFDVNFSMSSDTGNSLHLAYIDSGDDVQYTKYDGTSWGSAATLDNTGTNKYVSVSVDTSNNDIYVVYLDTAVPKAYYVKYSGSWGSVTDTGWTTNTNPRYLTTNYADSERIFGEWTSGTSSPYTFNWNYIIIIPERLWMLLGLGLLIPKFLKKRKGRLVKVNKT